MKRLCSMILALVMVFAMLPAAVSASTAVASGTCGDDVVWHLSSDGLLLISGTGPMEDYKGGYNTPWKNSRSSITAVLIEPGVTSIGSHAFDGCTKMTEVMIPDSVTVIGAEAFYNCSGLTEVTIPSGVISIGDGAFYFCNALESIWVHDGNSVYSNDDLGILFDKDKTQLLYVPYAIRGTYSVPEGVEYIASGAFYSSRVSKLIIPASVISIGDRAFQFCDYLTNIQVNAGNQHYSSVDGALLNKEQTELIRVPAVDSYVYAVPEGVTVISPYAFFSYASSKVTLADSVITIADHAFDSCSRLRSITIPDSVTSIGAEAFYNCFQLAEVSIGNGVTMIGDKAFYGCALTSVTIPGSVTYLGEGAFSYCDELTEVTVGKGVSAMGSNLFLSCSELKDVYFKGDAPKFDSRVFNGSELTAYYPAGNATWTEDVLQNYGGTITWMPYEAAVPGDLNGDGMLDDNDVAQLLWYTLFPEAYTLSGDADFTGDGIVNDADVAYLLWHTLFPESYPLN